MTSSEGPLFSLASGPPSLNPPLPVMGLQLGSSNTLYSSLFHSPFWPGFLTPDRIPAMDQTISLKEQTKFFSHAMYSVLVWESM